MAHSAKAEFEGQVSPLAEQLPNLRFLGLGAWWAWIWLCYNSIEIMRMFPASSQTPLVLQMYLFSTLGIAVSMFVAALGWKRVAPLVDKSTVVLGFGLIAGLATLLLGFSVVMGAGIFFVLAALSTGIGTSFLCLKVGQLYGSVSLGDSLTSGAISLLFAGLLYFCGIGIPPEWRLFYIAALPIVSALLLVAGAVDPFSSARSGAGEIGGRVSPERRMYHKLVLASALVAFSAGVGKGVSSSLMSIEVFAREGSITVFSLCVIAVGIVFVVNRGDAMRGARQVYSALMVLGVAMMLATCFGFDIAFLSVGKEALWLMFSCFMAYLAFRYDLSPVRVFGVGQGLYFLSSTAGWVVGAALAPYYGELMVRMGVGVGLAFMVILVLVYVFPESDLKRIMAWSADADLRVPQSRRLQDDTGLRGTSCVQNEVNEAGGMQATARASDLVRAADEKYGLSARELEILDLFAQGRSANWIADNLVISKNTVRSHLRAIYTKLNIHTRQELLDLLEG